MGHSVRFAWLAFLLLVANSAFPVNEISPRDSNHFSSNPAAIIQAASELSAPAGGDVVILRDEQSRVFEADGRSTSTYYLIFKVITQKGAEDWADTSLSWEPWHEDRPTIKARVITPDQVEHVLDPRTIADAAAHEADSKIYSDRRVLRAPLPAVTPGAVVEEEFIEKESAPIFGAGTLGTFYFGRSVPVNRARLVLDAPASLSLQYRLQLLPDLKPQRTEENGRVRVVFEAGPLEALVNALTYLPSDVPAYPHVTFSTGASWQKIAEEYSRIVDERIATTDVHPLVKKLIAGKLDRDEKIAAIVQDLNRQVRYTGIEFGEAGLIPHSPSETLGRKYGDCKDKSVLLVSLLRAAGIEAYIALLNSGFDGDVEPDLPGMGMFDHAIVFVPGSPDLWIDATDEYARPGQLPSSDQGRFSLIARNNESRLRQIPGSPSTDNLLVENREFYLAENGPARIVETSEPHGRWEAGYRQSYADKDNKESKDQLTNYMKTQYLAENLDLFERSDPKDISQPFRLTLESKRAKRGFTELESAVAAVRLETLFSRLPSELQSRERPDDHQDATAATPTKNRTADYQLQEAFVTEWRYKIVPPSGFRAKPLPKNQSLSLGPSSFTEEFSTDSKGVVHAVFRFDMARRRFSMSEATEMRNKIAELKDGQPVLIYFETTAKALFSEGKVKESFQAYRDLIAQHPQEAVHHLQLAQALLEGGIGQAAREEAKLAVKLEPTSVLAQKTLAEIFEYDLVGRKFRPGSDYAGAEAAFRAARKLDPNDKDVSVNLALLLEYNSDGERYGPGAKLKDATAGYFTLTTDELAEIGLRSNPAYTLLYSDQFAEALKYAETLNPSPTAVIVAATTVLQGMDAGVEEARKRTANDDELKQIQKAAGEILMRLRKYAPAADLLQAGAEGDNASKTVALASMLRKARPREELKFEDTPAGVVERAFSLLTEPGITIDRLNAYSSRNARLVMSLSDADEVEQSLNAGRGLRSMFARSGLPADVMVDIMMPMLDPTAEGTDASGYRVTLHLPGTTDKVMFVVREDGHYKLLDSSEKPNAIGIEILDRIAAHDLAAARQMLDWLRDIQHLAGGDDPFEGEAFPRFWTQGKDADANQMTLAAASLLVQTRPTAKKGISILESARGVAATESERVNIDLALARGYFVTNDYEKALAIISVFASQNPQSRVLFGSRCFALRGLRQWSEIERIAQERLSRKPQDLDAMRALVEASEGRGDFKLARSIGRKVIASGKAEAPDLNNAAWDALFTGSVEPEDVDTAVKATQMSQDKSYALHTLGCVYAEVGKTQQARELFLQAMDALDLRDPNADYWYAFGRIAEQYGQREIAISLYSQVTEPKQKFPVPNSSYRLAQMRLGILGQAAKAPAKPATN